MGAQELLILGIVGFVLFGAKKLPELARSLGSSVTEFKKALKEDEGGTAVGQQHRAAAADSRAALPPSGEARPS